MLIVRMVELVVFVALLCCLCRWFSMVFGFGCGLLLVTEFGGFL